MKREGWYDEKGKTRRGLPKAHLESFCRDVGKLVAQYFEKDEDGDYPVSLDILDRTAFENDSYMAMPRMQDFMHPTPQEAYRRLEIAVGNSRSASEQLHRTMYDVRELLNKAKAK